MERIRNVFAVPPQKSRKLLVLCCSFQLLIGFTGLAVSLWIYWSGVNKDVKDFMLGLIVSSYFMFIATMGLMGQSCKSACMLISHASSAILSTLICAAVSCLYLTSLLGTRYHGFRPADKAWQNMIILCGSLLTSVSFCLSMLLAYRHRNDGVGEDVIAMPNIIPGTQQAASYVRGSVSAVNETSRRLINHASQKPVMSFRPPSSSRPYSRLPDDDYRSISHVSGYYLGDEMTSTLDRSASRMSRKSLGPPRPPPPRSRPVSRIDSSDSRHGTLERKQNQQVMESDLSGTDNIRGESRISERPESENEVTSEAARTELIEHARRILEADMKRRQREKRSRPATRAELHDTKSKNPFGSNLETPVPRTPRAKSAVPHRTPDTKKGQKETSKKTIQPPKFEPKAPPVDSANASVFGIPGFSTRHAITRHPYPQT